MEDFQHCFDGASSETYILLYMILTALFLGLVPSYYIVRHFYPTQRNHLRVIGQIQFDTRNHIGRNVFRGRLLRDGRRVAIKRFGKLSRESVRELGILVDIADKGPPKNVIQYFWYEHDTLHTYIALELCNGDLKDAVTNHVEQVLPYLSPDHCLFQLVHGLQYVHHLNIQHRDLKPGNILWRYSGANPNEVRFIISDFDLGQHSSDVSSHTAMYGTKGWAAPELWCARDEERTFVVDIFSMGCVFFYVLTMGGHPFGPVADLSLCQSNIVEHEFVVSLGALNDTCSELVVGLAQNLISRMIEHESSKRPQVQVVLEHPLLWSKKRMMEFYHAIGNYMEDKGPSLDRLREMLEHDSANVFEGSWMERLDKPVQKDVQGFKKQSRDICGLLRVVRNKMEHFRHLRQELKGIYNNSPEGVLDYYNERFPSLLMYTISVEKQWVAESSKL